MESLHHRRERLRTLYQMMAGIPAEFVNLGSWRRSAGGMRIVPDKVLLRHECGTAACAMGWATAYPEFIAMGLHKDIDGEPIFNGLRHYDAAASFFGIDDTQSYRLFSPNYGMRDDKEVFLGRLRNLMVELRMITRQRSDELESEETEAACVA